MLLITDCFSSLLALQIEVELFEKSKDPNIISFQRSNNARADCRDFSSTSSYFLSLLL